MLIYQKTVDRSLLKEGFAVRVREQQQLLDSLGLYVPRGVKVPITIILEGQEYPAKLMNTLFDELDYPNHCDLLSIRYRLNGDLARRLQRIFWYTKDLLQTLRSQNRSTRKISDDQREYCTFPIFLNGEP